MGPKPSQPQTGELFGDPLRDHLNLKHPLILLGDRIQWERIDALVADQFKSRTGRPATSPRLIAGLLYLQHAFDLSDEEVVATWVENPYWQVFTGEIYLQTRPPIDPSSLTRWRKRLGEAGVEEMLSLTLVLAQELGMLRESSLKTVIVDTTVMPKAIAHPTDSRLLERKPQRPVLHGVNGSTLKATTALAMLNWLSRPSYSRPRVSDDNAFVEALFKTAKYRPEFPAGGMASLDSKSLQPTGQVNHSTRKPFSPTPAELHLPR